jgi:ABC-2 type transport system ATP-binding protein
MDERMIHISGLVKTYKNSDIPAVDHLNLEIEKGCLYGLLGPNGAGKTTTLNILSGLLKPDLGVITIAGYHLPGQLTAIKRIIGIVPQEIALYQDLTALENLKFFGHMYQIPDKILNSRIDTYLKKLGLFNRRKKRIKYYSGGMKRRINLIAGLLHHPAILFLDEPTVGVDVQSKKVILDFLKELNETGMTMIYTSHLMEEAQDLCNKITIIDMGKNIADGNPEELIRQCDGCRNLEDVFIKLTGKALRDK